MATLSEVAERGVRLDILRSLRGVVAVAIDDCRSSRDLAALTRQMVQLLAEIDEVAASSGEKRKETPLDELSKRRSRPAAAAGGGRAKRG